MSLFESYERRIDKINAVLTEYGITSIEEAARICEGKGFSPYNIVKGVQPIAFENAAWAYTVGAAIAIQKGCRTAAEAAEAIGWVCRLSAFQVRWRKSAKWAWDMAIWAQCCCGMRRNVLRFWPT